MRAFRRSVALMGAVLLAVSAAFVQADSPSPCVGARVRCQAGERFLQVVYDLELQNPTETAADVVLLPSVDTLEQVEGVRGDLVVNRAGDALRASVPAGWKGRVGVRARQRIERPAGRAASVARLPMPPAVWRTVEADLPGPRADLSAGPDAVVSPLGDAGGRSRFRILPLGTGTIELEWTQRPPVREASYSFAQTHDLTEYPPEFDDNVTLEFGFDGAPPSSLSVQVPAGADVQAVEPTGGVRWQLSGGAIEVSLPEHFAGDRLALTCRVAGVTRDVGQGAQSLRVPVFLCPGAARTEGRVLVSGGRHELTFERLEGAAQTAAEGGAHKLSCVFRRPDPVIAVRVVPIRATAKAGVETLYEVSAHRVAGTHRVSVDYGEAARATVLMLPGGHVVRDVRSRASAPDWTQEGNRLRVEPPTPGAGAVEFTVSTEALTDRQRRFALSLPTVLHVDSTDYWLGLSAADDVQMTNGGPAEPWGVAGERLPQWLRGHRPAAAYAFRDRPLEVQLEVHPVQPELGGSVQDHVTMQEDHVLREVLFTLEVRRRPISDLHVLLPAGLTAERIDGPAIESWEQPGDGSDLLVRFRGPVLGPLHFRLVATEPASPGQVVLRGIALRDAPNLKGWCGVSGDVSVSVRPLEDGQTNLRSLRIEHAPDYLKAFDNKLLYELYDSRWRLDLRTEIVPPVYSAHVLNVLQFRAAQVEATAFVRVAVERGGVGELEFELPAAAVSPRFEGTDVVLSQGEGRAWHVRFRGRRTGTFDCVLHYDVVTGMGAATFDVEPLRLRGAREQDGELLLLQSRPDVEVRPGPPPAALAAADAQERYDPWGYSRELPALAAYTYRGADWSLPVSVQARALSDIMLSARITQAKLDTLVQDNDETLHHLRLYVSNTNRQFLPIDLDALGPGARLIGTYAFDEPIKPFREGERKLQIPLFTSEWAARLKMSVIDITYATRGSALTPFARQDMAAPDLGLNVREFEWTVRMPEGCRLAAVGGNMGKPVGPSPAPSLAGRLLEAAWNLAHSHAGALIVIAVIAAACAAGYGVVRLCARHGSMMAKAFRIAGLSVVVLLLVVVLGGLFMPALATARKEARKASQKSNLHNIGLGINMFRSDTGGEYPPDLDAVLKAGYFEDASVLHWDEQEVVYRKPSADAPAETAVAYFWPPSGGVGANVLFADSAVEWVPLKDDGELRNPRNGELLATYHPEAGKPGALYAARARPGATAFGESAITAEELQQAMQAEQEIGPAEQPMAAAEVRRRQEALDEMVLEANRDKLDAALERFRADHNGRTPETIGDIDPYLGDRQLADILRRHGEPALARARPEARRAKQLSNLHNIGLGLTMHMNARGGEAPSTLDALVAEGYLDDASILQWPGQTLVYRRPEAGAPDSEVVAYFWPPQEGAAGASVLFKGGTVEWVPLDAAGALRNPRSGRSEWIAGGFPALVTGGVRAGEAPEVDKQQLAVDRYNLAMAQVEAGDYKDAESNLEQALRFDESHAQARSQLRQVQAMQRVAGAEAKAVGMSGEQAEGARSIGLPWNAQKSKQDLDRVERQLEQREQTALGGLVLGGREVTTPSRAASQSEAGPAQQIVQRRRGAAAQRGELVAQNGIRELVTVPDEAFDYQNGRALQSVIGGLEPAAVPAPTEPALRFRKGTLVQQLPGGRSTGALPIPIDFPAVRSTTYFFVKPFLGRTEAALWFRPVGRAAALAFELALAAVAFALFLVLRERRTGLSTPFAALAFLAAMAAVLAAPAATGGLFASTALAMALCLIAEALLALTTLRSPASGVADER